MMKKKWICLALLGAIAFWVYKMGKKGESMREATE